jgi:hypothetical protein
MCRKEINLEVEEMSPDKKEIIDGKKVEEYYWAGRYVVYVNNCAVKGNFKDTCVAIRKGLRLEWLDEKIKGY